MIILLITVIPIDIIINITTIINPNIDTCMYAHLNSLFLIFLSSLFAIVSF